MAEIRKHADDQLVTRYANSRGMVMEWESHETGERYGGQFSRQQGRDLMVAEGLDPDRFNKSIG